jgi:hypothetical protein
VFSKFVFTDRFGSIFARTMPTIERGEKMKATIENTGGIPSHLSAMTIKVRDAVIQKCEGQNLEEMTQFIKQLLEHETNEQKRLGVLAARVYLLREKIAFLLEQSFDSDSAEMIRQRHSENMENLKKPSGAQKKSAKKDEKNEEAAAEGDGWMRVRILEDSEVNEIRFPAGVVIDVHTSDAQKLVDAGKAEKIIQDSADNDDTGDADTAAETTDEQSKDESANQAPEEAKSDEAADDANDDAGDDEEETAAENDKS